MQFQNPEILYFLFLLIIPILIHLFQLQKFEKVPFTNVSFLQKIIKENRKSSKLKKWLILATRLLLLTAILFSFSQPYLSDKKEDAKQHTLIYIDDSFSTNSNGKKGDLLKTSTKEIIENAPKNDLYTLATNTNIYENISYKELKNMLLNLKNSHEKSDFKSLFLKINSLNKIKTKTLNKNILISDFQNTYKYLFTNVTRPFSTIQLKPNTKSNISVDSVYLKNSTNNNSIINIEVNNQGEAKENIPIGIYSKNKLISKQTFSVEKDSKKNISFTIQNNLESNYKISITYNDTFNFDNTYYFTKNPMRKVNILSIGKKTNYLKKIYTSDEFNFKEFSVKKLDFNLIPKQDLIILNELQYIPNIVSKNIIEFTKNGGTLLIIPNSKIEIESYNRFFTNFSKFRINEKSLDSLKITSINFSHPIFKNVFSKKISNFQYPKANEYFPNNSKGENNIIKFENNMSFITQFNSTSKKIYWLSSSLDTQISNFSKSPLIVPVFYNFGKLSFKQTQLYYSLDNDNTIDIETELKKDEILTLSNQNSSFIPMQQTLQNKVRISLRNQKLTPGFYNILKNQDTIKTIAFNIPKDESLLNFLDINSISKSENITTYSSIKELFKNIKSQNEVHWLWRWFLSLAIVSLFLEILILKFYKS